MTLPQRIMIIAWGSRGDIQPVTALAKRLKAQGRDVLVFATPPATDVLLDNGIECIVAGENVADVIGHLFGELDLSNRSPRGQLKLALAAKKFLDSPEYVATQEADMRRAYSAAQEFRPDLLLTPNIIYGPFMSIAEALRIPLVTFDLQINYPTSEYPLFTMQVDKFPKFINRAVYTIKALAYPRTIRSKFDLMRDICGLPRRTYTDGSKFKIWPHNLPQACAVSPSLCPRPSDWPPQKVMTGWWFLESNETYVPDPSLADFMRHQPVYIGFGSMVGNPEFRPMLSTLAITSLREAGTPGVLLGGWAGLSREAIDTSSESGRQLYEWAAANVYEIDSVPHDWLFPQCSAVVHHGGAGTLAAGIRAGRPTVVCAIQGDQPFHGSLVEARGIGEYLGMVGSPKLTSRKISMAINRVTTDANILSAATRMGEKVRSEDGTGRAIDFLDRMAASFSYPWPTQ